MTCAAPRPFTIALFTASLSSVWVVLDWFLSGWAVVAAYLACYAAAVTALHRWSRRSGFRQAHVLAAAAGALLTYAWQAFVQEPLIGSGGRVDQVGNAVFAAITACLIAVAALRVASRAQQPRESPARH